MSALDSPMKRMDINCDKENVAPPSSKTEKAETDKFSVPAIAPVAEPKVRLFNIHVTWTMSHIFVAIMRKF